MHPPENRLDAPSELGSVPSRVAAQSEATRLKQAAERHAQSTQDDRYSNLNLANLLSFQQVERGILQAFRRRGWTDFAQTKVLEVGCGSARWLREFIKWGARPENLFGVDLIEKRIAFGREICPAAVRLAVGNAERLEFADGSFDVVVQSTMFTSILDPRIKHAVAREIVRVLKPQGLVVWYDFVWNSPRNPDVRGIGKKEIRDLFPGSHIDLQRVTLAPPIGRALAPISSALYVAASKLPFLRSHCLAFILKPAA